MTRRGGGPDLRERWQRVERFLTEDIWKFEGEGLSSLRRGVLRAARIVLLTVRGFVRDKCMMRAGSLTYVTIFSLVPLLAVSFAVAKGLGADETLQERFIEPMLDEVFGERAEPAAEAAAPQEETAEGDAAAGDAAGDAAAGDSDWESSGGEPEAGEQLRTAVDQVFAFVRRTNFTSLGAFSLIFLLYCVVKLLGATESALNEIWGVRNTRAFTRRLTNYIAIVVMTPMVVITATGFTALLESETYRGITGFLDVELKSPFLALLPFVVVSAAMTFLYLALPNTRVRIASAILGGIVGGFLWQLVQVLHVELQVGMARLNAIYSGFAALPLFLLWVYLNWATLLLGAQLAYAHQNEAVYTSLVRAGKADQSFLERLALRLAARVASAFVQARPAPNAAALASDLGLTSRTVEPVMERLCAHGLLARTDDETEQGYLPARPPESIAVGDVLVAMRHDEDVDAPPTPHAVDRRVDRLFAGLEEELAASRHNESLARLVAELDEEEDEARVASGEPGARAVRAST